MSFLGEIQRRKVFQVGAVYAVVAWLIMQVIDVVNEPLSLPEWFDTVIILLLAAGFPITLVMSWAFNLTAEGLVRDPGDSTSAAPRGRTIEQVLLGLLIVAVGWLLYQDFRPSTEAAVTSEIAAESGSTSGEAAVDAVAPDDRLPNSIAVLPLTNLSPDPNNAYFAAGIHEEILNQLARIRDLNVIARTSVLEYADVQRDITEIARELNVGAVMEGSVAYAEGRVAVTVQLIDADRGVHLWSERYNREFANIFDIQTDIAINIANSLDAEFSAAEQTRLARIPTNSPEAYSLYLQALDPPADPNLTQQELAVVRDEYLQRALALDPEFAVAHAYRAQIFASRGRGAFRVEDDWEALVRGAARQALAIDPGLASAHAAVAAIDHAFWRWADAAQAYERAYTLDPKDPGVLESYGTFNRDIGDYSGSIRLLSQLAELDPKASRVQLGISYFYARDYDAALEVAEEEMRAQPSAGTTHMRVGFVEVARGNYARGLEELAIAERLPIAGSTVFWRTAQLALAYGRAGERDDVERLVAPTIRANDPIEIERADRVAVRIALGRYDEAMQELEEILTDPVGENLSLLGMIKANPFADPVLDSPEWQAIRDRIASL